MARLRTPIAALLAASFALASPALAQNVAGSISGTVTAEGTPVETTAAERSALLSSKQLELVAVRSRDVVALLKVLPGVTASQDYTETEALGSGFGTRVPNIQGARESWSSFTVDGV